MKNFKRNYKKNRFRNNGEKIYKKNGGLHKIGSDLNSNFSFKRINQNRNNHNPSKLAEKYKNLAKEALTNGDKILYENYLQHADHFIRIFSERENVKVYEKNSNENLNSSNDDKIEEKDLKMNETKFIES